MLKHTEFAMVFPGQGSQSIGMLAELAAAFPVVQETFEQASDALGYDLWAITQADEAKLNQTAYTQPALLAASVATWRVWAAQTTVLPAFLAGHSLGEYSALVCAGAMQFTDAVVLVSKRGQFMQEAVAEGEGAMAAVLGLDDATVKHICDVCAQDQVLSAVNFNAIGQVVVAGNREAVDRLMEKAKGAGAKRVLPLPVSVPSHCDLMRPASRRLAEILESTTIERPSIPVFHNADARVHKTASGIREALVKQLYSPVPWVETMRLLYDLGARSFVECGPGKVLTGLIKRILKDVSLMNLGVASDIDAVCQALSSDSEATLIE